MSSASLYLIQSNVQRTAAVLDQLSSIWAQGDQVILMGESVLNHQHPFVQSLEQCFALSTDMALLSSEHPFTVIDYPEFAHLCLQFTRCIRLK